ncbi:MAG: hypothetical protein KatS3mg122_2147 [Caldimonas sp.]|nr:MAG: hypothetical protein KatS3mg122_2147 [Caldimonas sp.]
MRAARRCRAATGWGACASIEPTLFGGDEREGGVVGDLDVLAGSAAQDRNDYLMSRLGAAIPAFRGVLSIVARKILFAANNPYLKPWAVRVRRFTAGWHDEPWMPWNAEVRTWDADTGTSLTVGMNPAHILVQCLTDPHWGMGYPPSTLGASFWNAAWALEAEGFGLNLVWTRQQPIEAFIAQVLDHVGGILYLDPEQGTLRAQAAARRLLDRGPAAPGPRRDRARGALRARAVGGTAQRDHRGLHRLGDRPRSPPSRCRTSPRSNCKAA